jgi:hypothetical protein
MEMQYAIARFLSHRFAYRGDTESATAGGG